MANDLAVENLIQTWRHRLPWEIVSHEEDCCWNFRSWLKCMASSFRQDNVSDLPSFILQRWPWGPTRPAYAWCDLLKTKTAECGTLAAICQAVYLQKNIPAYRVQTIERHPLSDIRNWQIIWHKADVTPDWIHASLAYHEMVAICIEGVIKIWDSTSWRWIERSDPFFAGILAMRIFGPPKEILVWQGKPILPWQWTIL